MSAARHPRRQAAIGQRGALLIEVLVAILICAFGLLGFAGMQARAASSEFEGFQRSQALVLVEDMVSRMNANRAHAGEYVSGGLIGEGDLVDCSGLAAAALDLCEWGNLIRGSAERRGGSGIGAMLSARGCITRAPTRTTATSSASPAGVMPTPGADTLGAGRHPTRRFDARRRRRSASPCCAMLGAAGAAAAREGLNEAARFAPQETRRTFRIHMSDIGEAGFLRRVDANARVRRDARAGVKIETAATPPSCCARTSASPASTARPRWPARSTPSRIRAASRRRDGAERR